MKKLQNMKGITLIALVITIVVLLILAGVTIAMLTGDNGILTKAQTSKTKSAEEEARERVSLMLAEWKMENATDAVTIQEYLEATSGKYYNQIQAQGIENITKSEEEGLYYAYVIIGGQDYYVEIYVGNAGKVTIGEVLTSLNTIMFGVNMEPQYVFSGNVEVTITATAPDGKTITNIEINEDGVTSGDIVDPGTQTASRTFTLAADADNEKSYIFIATDNEGETKRKPITIKTLPKPEIDVTQNGAYITINVTNSDTYPEGTKFKYYVGDDDTTGTESTGNSYTKTGLTLGETYNIRVKAYYDNEENAKESDVRNITCDERMYLYKDGNEYEDITGGWKEYTNHLPPGDESQINRNNDNVTLVASNPYGVSWFYIENLDLSGFKEFHYVASVVVPTYYTNAYPCTNWLVKRSNLLGDPINSQCISAHTETSDRQEYVVDISNITLTNEEWIGFQCQNYGSSIVIYKVWLE